MIILEIILTIVAWNRGWRWLSLIPIVACFLIGFFIGIYAVQSGTPVEEFKNLFVIDLIGIIALVVMIAYKRDTKNIDSK